MKSFDQCVMALWAKKEERGSRFLWLPLIVHLADTMNVSRWLWTNWISDSQREFCINEIEPSGEDAALNLAAFLGAIHDIGKATPAFQIQKGYQNSPDLDGMLLEKLEQSGFAGIADLSLVNRERSHHSIAGEYLLKEEFGVKDDIGSIVGGHHGKPADDLLMIEDQRAYAENYFQCDDDHLTLCERWKRAQREIFQWALNSSGFDSAKKLPKISQPAQVIYSGLLIMADWISSNCEYFPLIDVESDSMPDCTERYRKGVTLWGADLPLQIESYPEAEELFVRRFGFKPREFQNTVCRTVSQIRKPGIMILEAPMGVGKTEAALAAAEEVAAKAGSSGLFFGLPTQATSNGMFGRIRQWLETLTSEYDTKQSLRLCHGKAALNEEMNNLKSAASAQGIDIDDGGSGSIYVNEWFSGRKKTSLDDFVVGTVDGFLLTALKQKHLALRHLGFSKKVVIIDEVHAYDAYMQQYLEEAIRWMGSYGTPVILASATLPPDKRKSFISAYLKGMGLKNREIEFPEAISGCSYPLVSYSEGREVKVQKDFSPVKDKIVHVKKLDEEELSGKLDELLNGEGVIGVIVNTVRRAQKFGEACKKRFGENTVDVLHSAFIAEDRVKKETDLMSMIGKHGNRPQRKIIIGTQVMEQSLDIDFDVLITDLCPIDLLLQRIGRLQRHDIERPAKFREPCVYIMGTSDRLEFERGSERIYGSYFLIRTQFYLPDEIRIPSDIPILINEVYGDETPELPGDLMSAYQRSCERMKALQEDRKFKAMTYRVGHPGSKKNLIGWLKNPDQSNSDEMASAQVRDITETIEVIAVKRVGSGYGTFSSGEDISGRVDDPQIARELAGQTLRLPNYITARDGISRIIDDLEKYNRQYLSDWQNQPWLEGSLGIIFDEEGRFKLGDTFLKYDSEFGLQEDKEYGKV
jgi:CRISPR-associated endonuclease/helicase Cas3